MPYDLNGTNTSVRVNDNGSLGQIIYQGSEYILSGSTVYNFSLGVNGASVSAGLENTAHNPFTFISTNKSFGTQKKVEQIGSYAGLRVTRVIEFDQSSNVIKISTTLTNTTAAALNSIVFMDNLDPDPAGIFSTSNDVIGSKLVVSTAGSKSIGLASKEPNVFASAIGFSNTNPYSYLSVTDPNGATSDIGINLATNIGTLAAGQSVARQSYLILGNSSTEVVNTFASLPSTSASSGNDSILTGDNNDHIYASLGSDSVNGGAGYDTLNYSFLGQAITILPTGIVRKSGGGQDVITSIENIVGGVGYTNIIDASTATGGATLNANLGTGTVSVGGIPFVVSFNVSNFTGVRGTANNDILTGSILNDQLYSNAGNDTIHGSSGNDFIDGGSGYDTVSYSYLGEAITVLAQGFVNKGTQGFDTLVGFENIIGASGVDNTLDASTATGTASIDANLNSGVVNVYGLGFPLSFTLSNFVNAIGSLNADTITGNFQNNYLDGGSGNDSFVGTAGDDVIVGGIGVDTMNYSSLGQAVTLYSQGLVVKGALGVDQLNEMEQIIGASGQTNSIDASDAFSGATINVDLLANRLTVNGTGAPVPLQFSVFNFVNVIGTDGADSITGNALANTLKGGLGNDRLVGGAGNDALLGGAGSDTMLGGIGNDTYEVNTTLDIVQENLNEGNDTVLSSVSYTLGANVENLTLQGFGTSNGFGNTSNNLIQGNGRNNTLRGESGNDTLRGNAGNDLLIGGLGNDILTGGAGLDSFVFYSAAERGDQITDFSVIDDSFRISAAGFGGGLIANTVLSSSRFNYGVAANSSLTRFVYDTNTGSLFYDSDGTGLGTSLKIATLTNRAFISDADFVII